MFNSLIKLNLYKISSWKITIIIDRRRHSKEKKSNYRNRKRSISKSRSESKDRRKTKDDKRHQKSDRYKDEIDKEERNKPEEIKYANTENTAENPRNNSEGKPSNIEDLEKSKREILNMHIEKK